MIQLTSLTKRYGDVVAVDDLTFTVRPGLVTGFLGPNGAGKTATMRMILGLDLPTSGSATIDGHPHRDLRDPLRVIGSLLDARAVHPQRTAYKHLLYLAQSNSIPAVRVAEVLDLVGLSDVAGRKAGGFSLGMSQRLGIAAALLGDPPVVVLDEPVNGLDPEGVRWIRALIRGLAAEGRTVLVSSHLMSEMAMTADRLVVIGKGRLVAEAAIDEFTEAGSTVLVRTPEAAALSRLLRLSGAHVQAGDEDELLVTGMTAPDVGRLAAAEDVPLFELTQRRVSLEDAFMELTRDSVEYGAAR
ncbi:ATP-binding cassette domain-containing protein [Nonomuraea sp. KC401]|uniref:ABC transporter ATP-binding protein n=1 Tax=unclassified Nonomuraea TaxID=2593643 RepID=UPI0010FE9097|nr:MULTISPECIES: ATP-binding cassette domain-containing protein [unclassified Nonomuraea]NBF00121.1 ATP-binding cassette domain-containing protein [Nonomuraea sp. K271]TLF54023.1 ATP-binding cassette domain-containing protein [Nonomuraea sp. KC401]